MTAKLAHMSMALWLRMGAAAPMNPSLRIGMSVVVAASVNSGSWFLVVRSAAVLVLVAVVGCVVVLEVVIFVEVVGVVVGCRGENGSGLMATACTPTRPSKTEEDSNRSMMVSSISSRILSV